jgi:hypothetical protein
MTNPFSKDYVPQLKIDHKDRTYKRPVLNQPPKNARTVLDHKRDTGTLTDTYRRISQSDI